MQGNLRSVAHIIAIRASYSRHIVRVSVIGHTKPNSQSNLSKTIIAQSIKKSILLACHPRSTGYFRVRFATTVLLVLALLLPK